MVVTCPKCNARYDDEYRWTICPHNPLYRAHDAVLCRVHDLFRPCQACEVTGGEVPKKWYDPLTGQLRANEIILEFEFAYKDITGEFFLYEMFHQLG